MPAKSKAFALTTHTDTNRNSQLLTETEMAQRLGCCGRTVRRLRYQGIIPILRVGRLVRYNADDVLQALEQSAKETPAENP